MLERGERNLHDGSTWIDSVFTAYDFGSSDDTVDGFQANKPKGQAGYFGRGRDQRLPTERK